MRSARRLLTGSFWRYAKAVMRLLRMRQGLYQTIRAPSRLLLNNVCVLENGVKMRLEKARSIVVQNNKPESES